MKARIFWIDIVKFIAILFVILAHVVWIVEQGIQVNCILSNDFLTINRIIATLGVPLFMMVSGSLLLGKDFKLKSDIFAFYKRGLLPLFITAEIWIVIYCLVTIRPFSLKEMLLCMTFVHKPEVHLWYVRLIVIYYLLIPFLNCLRSKRFSFYISLLIVIAAFTFIYNGWLILKGDLCPTNSNRSYFCYLIYMAIGYKISRIKLSKSIFAISFILAIVGGHVLFLSLTRVNYFLWYDNPMIALISLSLFYIIRHLCNSFKDNKLIVEISKMSYGIYLSHFILIYIIGRFILFYGCIIGIFYLSLLAVILIDITIIWSVKKVIPIFSKVFFRY